MERKNFFLSIVALVVLTALLALPAQAEQLRSRESQGNNVGVKSTLGWGMPWTGGANWHYPRGSANEITNDGWTMAIYAAIDLDGAASDTEGINHLRAMMPGLASLESKAAIEAEAAAGSYMEGEMGETRYNRIWTNLDASELADWPIEGRIPRGDPNGVPDVATGGETQFFHSSDVFTSWGFTKAPAGAAYEWTLRFLNFAESNSMVYGSLFIRNMSEYAQYNPVGTYSTYGKAHPSGWNWSGAVLCVNHRSLGYSGTAAGWALKASKEILCFYGRSPTSGAWTPNKLPLFGFKMINPPHNERESMHMTSIHHHDWDAEFGFSGHRQMFVGFPYGVSYRVAMDQETGYYPGVINPWTGEQLRGAWPGMLQPEDARYDQWIWGGPSSFMTYACFGEMHDVAPRDTITCDYAYAFTSPGVDNYVRPELDVANIDDPLMQEIMNPIEHMMEVAEVVINGGYSLPNTPVMPPLTIVPGDREVTITWSDLPLQQPDAYYYFLQANPALDPNGLYREYDFEGFRVYRSYVGPNDSHSELLGDFNFSDNNLQFYYIDRNEDDLNRYRMRNGMKVWYAVVPYDLNYDPATGESFSLPDPASGKTWNRPGSELYTVLPRSDASNFETASLASVEFVPAANASSYLPTNTIELAGDGSGKLTEAVKLLSPAPEVVLDPVIAEKITQEQIAYLAVASMEATNGVCGNRLVSRMYYELTGSGGAVYDDLAPPVKFRNGDEYTRVFSKLGSDGVEYALNVTFNKLQTGSIFYSIDMGGYSGAVIDGYEYRCGVKQIGESEPSNPGYNRAGNFQVTWQTANNGELTLKVTNQTRGVDVPFSPWMQPGIWGFITPLTEDRLIHDEDRDHIPYADRVHLMVETIPADQADDFALYLNGFAWKISGITSMPANGTVMNITNAWGTWNADKTVFTQYAEPAFTGDKYKITISPMTMEPEDADLEKIKVVPNPYMASSFLDLSMDSRRIEFVNLPDRCTIRIYTLKGNLVNVLNHVGANREGWGNFTDWDRLTPGTSEPAQYTGYDNHGGSEPWNLRNRWGQLVASGLYFFHVTDQRGETYTGKFYIVD